MKFEIKHFFGLLLFLFVARFTVLALMPLFDPSESRYATIAANMAAYHNFLIPQFIHNGVLQSFNGKPPLLFQAGGVLCLLFGRTLSAVRLPSLIAALLLLTVLYRTVSAFRTSAAAHTAVLICTTSMVFYALAGLCMTDMLLTLAVSGALLCHATFDRNGNRWDGFVIFVFLGIGMLAKGPVTLVLYGLPAFVHTLVNHRWTSIARLPWLAGIVTFLMITLPWYVLMARKDPNFLHYFFINENLLRFLVKEYGDKYGAGRETFRGMAIVWLVVVTLPWTPFAWKPLRTLGRTLFTQRNAATLPAIGILCITLFWCLTSRVPLPYLLPTVPLFAAWLAVNIPPHTLQRFLAPAACFVAALLPIIIGVAALTSDKLPGPFFEHVKQRAPSETRFSFADRQPYSGEFHLAHRLDIEPKPEDWLFIRTRNLNRNNETKHRPLLIKQSAWSLLGPVEKDSIK